VCGLRYKLLITEYFDSILKCDIFACLETKLDELDQINCNGYGSISKTRNQKALRKYVCIDVFVNKNIYHLLTEIWTEYEYVLLFKLNRNPFNAAEVVYLVSFMPHPLMYNEYHSMFNTR